MTQEGADGYVPMDPKSRGDMRYQEFQLGPRKEQHYIAPIPKDQMTPVRTADASGGMALEALRAGGFELPPDADDRLDVEFEAAVEDREALEALQAGGFASPAETVPTTDETPESILGNALQPVVDDVISGFQPSKIIGGGIINAGNAMLGLVDEAMSFANQVDEAAGAALGLPGYGEEPDDFEMQTPKIPNVWDMASSTGTVSGDMAQKIVQFLAGFGAAGVAIKGAGIGATLGKTMFAEFAAFDGHEMNLADLVESVPSLKNPVTDFLASKEESPEVFARLQNALANGSVAFALEPLLVALRGIRAHRMAKELSGQQTAEEVAAGLGDRSIGTASEAASADSATRIRELLGDSGEMPNAIDQAALTKRAQQALPDDEGFGVPDEYAASSMLRTAMEGEWRPPPDLAEMTAKVSAIEGPMPTGNPFADNVLRRGDVVIDEADIDSALRAAAIRYGDHQTPLDHFRAFNPDVRALAAKHGDETALDLVYAALAAADDAATGGAMAGGKLKPAASAEAFMRKTFLDVPDAPPPLPGSPVATLGGSEAPSGATGAVPWNWNRIETSEDVKSILGQMSDAFADDIATGGTQSFDQVKFSADNTNAWETLLGKRQAPLTNAAETLALRRLWTSSGRKLRELAAQAAEGDHHAAFAFRRMVAVHRLIQQVVKDTRTEQARALAQWRIPAGEAQEQLAQIDEVLRHSGGIETTQSLARAMADVAARPGGAAKVEELIHRGAMVKSVESVIEVWKAALLSGPQTHIVNAMSNAVVIPLAMAERHVAGRIGELLDPVAGVKLGEAAMMQRAMLDHSKDMLKVFWHGMKTGEQLYGTPFKEAEKAGLLGKQMGSGEASVKTEAAFVPRVSSEYWGVGADTLQGKALDVLGVPVQTVFRAMGSTDAVFKHLYYGAEVRAAAYREIQQRILKGELPRDPKAVSAAMHEMLANPSESLRMAAKDFAEYNTFTNDPGELINAVNKMRYASEGEGSSGNLMLNAMMHAVIPFLNTPANIARYTFERTPLAPLVGKWRADMAAGGTKRNLALARVGIGSMAMSIAYDLAMQGHITGSGPDSGDWAKRRTMTEAGWKAQSIRVVTGEKDGKPVFDYISINRLDPVGSILLMAAEMADIKKAADFSADDQWDELAIAAVFAGAEVFMNKTYLSGLSDIIGAIEDPDGRAEYYVNRLTKTLIPRAVAQVKRTGIPGVIDGDPIRRHTWDMISALKSDTPGLSKTLPAKRDFFGREVSYSSGYGWAYDTFMPLYVSSTDKALPVQREFMELDYFPTHKRSVRIKGRDGESASISLKNHPHIFEDLVVSTAATSASELLDKTAHMDGFFTKRGGSKTVRKDLMNFGDKTMTQAMNDIVTGKDEILGDAYKSGDAEQKTDILRSVLRSYRSHAKEIILEKYPELKAMRDQIPPRSERGERAPF